MGGGAFTPPPEKAYAEDQNFSELTSQSHSYLRGRDNVSTTVEENKFKGDDGLGIERLDSRTLSSSSRDSEISERRRSNAYREVLLNYEQLKNRSERLDEAKSKILSYFPGAWVEKVGGTRLNDYDVPKMTSLLLIGPKGSGKSSLINKISRVFEEDKFGPDRAQVSYNASVGDGTCFLQEYMIPRDSTSFCVYDSRSLCDESSININMVKDWIKNGVFHGKLVIRESDSSTIRSRLRFKAQENGSLSSEVRKVNFVIFVVDGIAVLNSIDNGNEVGAKYAQIITTTFNCAYMSFKDDKPVVVVTHGDLLSLADRTRVRVYLGELLGIHPVKQVFDIPECSDSTTELAIVDMLRYSLEHADKNLVHKSCAKKVFGLSASSFMYLLIILGIAVISVCWHHHSYHRNHAPEFKSHHTHHHATKLKHHHAADGPHIDWHAIRHMWLDEN